MEILQQKINLVTFRGQKDIAPLKEVGLAICNVYGVEFVEIRESFSEDLVKEKTFWTGKEITSSLPRYTYLLIYRGTGEQAHALLKGIRIFRIGYNFMRGA